jgi:FAD/FMN-containing dehydrogenase/alkanesulfonate monooxygenase SsuD/methylene tetrahydromethanopterin reductase-like flavin-dependent oxidoreductase (luciferase family)
MTTTDHGHPLRFGVTVPPGEPVTAVELARLAEELGLDLVTVRDDPDALDAWTLLSWIAGATSEVHLAVDGLDLVRRPAAVAARAAASLDLLSGGRLELGIAPVGADEAIEVVRALWVSDPTPVTFAGVHQRLAGAERGPAPAHEVPIWVGGPGSARTAPEPAGRLADGWSIALDGLDPDARRAGLAAVDAAARTAGRDPREIRRVATLTGSVDAETLEALARDEGFGTFLLATGDPGALRAFAAIVPVVRARVAVSRTAAGVRVGSIRSTAVRARRLPGIDYDAIPATLAGAAVEPGDVRYTSVRSNYLRGGSPGLVLRPSTTAEVVDALRYARRHDVPLGVRSGGHGISGRSTNDGGIVIDLAALNGIEVLDPATRRVRIGPGARWGEVAQALHPYGWAITSGDYGGVGVGGLATAGGIGFLAREHGLTIDHIRAVEVVLADGSVVRADEHHHPDLFWGVRGAGAALGIVTSFEFEADEVGELGFAQLTLDASDTAGLLRAYGSVVEAAPRDLTAFLILGPPRRGRPALATIMAAVDSADPDTIVERLQPLAGIGPLLSQQVVLTPYPGIVSLPEPGPHHGRGEPATRSALVEHITPEFARAAEDFLHSGATYFLQFRSVGGAVADVPPEATAYAHRSANFSAVAFGAHRRRLDAAWDEMAGHFRGLYWSFETDRRPGRLLDAYPPATLRRLQEVKCRYDPDGVFRDNVVIPAPDEGELVGS